MKRRTTLPIILGLLVVVLIITSIIALASKKVVNNLYFWVLLSCALGLIILGSLLSYFVHDRLFGFVNLVGTVLLLASCKMLYNYPQKITVIIIMMLFAGIINLGSVVFSVYRLPINDEAFDNHLFGELPPKPIYSILAYVLNFLVLIILIISELIAKMTINPFTCIVLLLIMSIGKFLSLFKKQRIGSLIICTLPIIILFGINPAELATDNSCVLLMVLEYLAIFTLVITEMVAIKPGVDTPIKPKEYK